MHTFRNLTAFFPYQISILFIEISSRFMLSNLLAFIALNQHLHESHDDWNKNLLTLYQIQWALHILISYIERNYGLRKNMSSAKYKMLSYLLIPTIYKHFDKIRLSPVYRCANPSSCILYCVASPIWHSRYFWFDDLLFYKHSFFCQCFSFGWLIVSSSEFQRIKITNNIINSEKI